MFWVPVQLFTDSFEIGNCGFFGTLFDDFWRYNGTFRFFGSKVRIVFIKSFGDSF